jgi:Protein of unknown function (DUF4013)
MSVDTLSTATAQPSEISATPARPSLAIRLLTGFGTLVGHAIRALIGWLLCFHYITSVLVVGWTFRLMRRRILYGWWKSSPARAELPFADFAATQGRGSVPGAAPNWIVSEWFRASLCRPGPSGAPPSLRRKLARLPRALLGALGWNLRMGLGAIACTYVLTLPGCFLWLAAWYDGWNNSFTKGYEQAPVGPVTGMVGNLLFILAMLYVPMAWAHLAATADSRAFFQFGFVWRLIRHRLGSVTLFILVFSLLTLPVSALRILPIGFTNDFPALEHASKALVRQILVAYNLACSVYVFVAFVAVHLLAARLYRSAVVKLLERDPAQVETLHPSLYRALSQLDLIPAGPPTRRHPLVAIVLGTGRRGRNALLWFAAFGLWFTVVVQVYVAQFLNFHPVLGWLNQPLIHLPSLFFQSAGGE